MSRPFQKIAGSGSAGLASNAFLLVVRHDRKRQSVECSVRKLITHALNMMTGLTTTIPLQLASVAGFAFSIFGNSAVRDVNR